MTPQKAALRISKKRKRCIPAIILVFVCILGAPHLAQIAAEMINKAPDAPTVEARKRELVHGLYFMAGAVASFVAIPLCIGLFTPTKEEIALLAYYNEKESRAEP